MKQPHTEGAVQHDHTGTGPAAHKVGGAGAGNVEPPARPDDEARGK